MRTRTKPAHLVLICLLTVSLFVLRCGESSTNPNGPNGPEQKLGATPTPSPSPSPTGNPSPSPSPSVSPSPSPSPSGNPSPSPSPSGSPSPSPSPSASPTPPASEVPFDVFFIEKAEVELDRGAGDHRFEVRGSFTFGMLSDGIDLASEHVFVRFGGFEQMILAGSFERHDDGFRFESDSAGIERLDIDDNGEYRVEARDLDLSNIMLPSEVNFLLRIGSDSGEWDIPFDSDGRFENPDPQPSPSPSPSPSVSPSPSPSPTVSPSPSPSPTVSPSPSPSPTGAAVKQ